MKFSILIPAYKDKFLKECLESVLLQTMDDYEILVLNDCSPYPVKSIVEECMTLKNGEKIKYYENSKNVGAIDVVDNWNKLLSLASGEFIICMGDDDRLKDNCLAVYESFIKERPDYDIYHARTEIIDSKSLVIDIQDSRNIYESVYELLGARGRINYVGDYLFRRATLKNKGGFVKFPMALASDWATVVLVASAKGIVNINVPIFQYRVSNITITSSGNPRKQAEATVLWGNWIQDFLNVAKPKDKIDKIYRKIILDGLEDNLRNSRIFFAARDIASRFFNILYWVKNRRQFKFSVLSIMIATIKGIYYKTKKI